MAYCSIAGSPATMSLAAGTSSSWAVDRFSSSIFQCTPDPRKSMYNHRYMLGVWFLSDAACLRTNVPRPDLRLQSSWIKPRYELFKPNHALSE